MSVFINPELAVRIRSVVQEHASRPKLRAFFFGSRARGDNGPRADIDIGLEAPQPIPVAVKFAIEEALDRLPTLLMFDVVNFTTAGPDFTARAKQHTIPIV